MGLGSDLSDNITNFLQQAPSGEPSSAQPQPTPVGPANQLFNSINQFNAGIPPIPTHEDLAKLVNMGAASNTRTAFSKGFGQLMEDAAPMAMYEQGATQYMPKPGEVQQGVTDYALGGQQPYEPQTPGEKIYQNSVARSVRSAPYALIGGPAGIATRQISNVLGNFGGEFAKYLFPNHPVIADIAGTLAGGSLPEGAVGIAKSLTHGIGDLFHTQGAAQREAVSQLGDNPAFNMPVSQVDDVLSKQAGSYWTPGRIDAASELNKRQAVNNILPPSAPTAAASGGKSLSDYMRDLVTYGVGEGFGGGIGHAISHYTGIDPTLTDIVGSQLGGVAAALAKYKLPRLFSSGDFDQRVSKLVSDPATWQALQQQQQQGGIARNLLGLGGVAAPAVNVVPGMGY